MSRLFYHTMQDNTGNLLFDVSGTMRLAGTGTLATIYGDEALTVILPNPMTNHPSFGSFKCFLGAGDYDFYMAKSGYTFETLTGVQGHGTMAQQNADAVAITGGTVTLLTSLITAGPVNLNGPHIINVGGPLHAFDTASVDGTTRFNSIVGMNGPPTAGNMATIHYNKATQTALQLQQQSDTGAGMALQFMNMNAVQVGSVFTNATTTAYYTTSDARLKDDVQPLTGALDVLRALNPVSFLWKADGSPGRGLLAGEVQDVIPDGVITGEKDAVDAEGQVVPQMIDYSKLVPYLIGAVKELTQQVEALTAQLAEASA